MERRRPPRWQRQVAGRRTSARRVLAFGAIMGLLGGIAMQPLLSSSGAGSSIFGLVRFSFIFPAALFVGWWLLGPGFSLSRGAAPAEPPVTDADDLTRRTEQLEHAFDDIAAPAARRSVRTGEVEWYRASIRRDVDPDAAVTLATAWGLGGRTKAAPREPEADGTLGR